MKVFINGLIRLPYGLLTLGWHLIKCIIGYIHSLVYRKEIFEENKADRYKQERARSLLNQHELMVDENIRNVEMMIEIKELLSKKYVFLGFYTFIEKTTWGTLGKTITTYFVYQNQSETKFIEYPKNIINLLRKVDNRMDLICEEKEIFEISGHLPGQFNKYRKERNYECTNVEIKTRATFIEGEYYFDKELNQRRIYITNVLTSALSNNGLATQALLFLKDLAKKNEIDKIHGQMSYYSDIETRQKLQKFYEKNGFTIDIDRGETKLDTFSLLLNPEWRE